MSATPRPSQKKQATLTSFFTPKSSAASANAGANAGANANVPPSSSPVASQSSLPSRKRPLEDEADQNKRQGSGGGRRSSGRGRFERAVKRARGESSGDENTGEANGEEDVDVDVDAIVQDTVDDLPIPPPGPQPAPAAAPSSPLRSSGRAERYIYDERRSRGAENGRKQRSAEPEKNGSGGGDGNKNKDDDKDEDKDEDEDDDPETKRRKAELHRKFVKKLGHPDSLAKIRRRNFVLGDDAAAGAAPPAADGDDNDGADGEGGNEEEEEQQPTKPTGKKKGGASGKLTPMELQFLAIKRQHLDTILVVEVGYKFRFLGEDARTAARVLGIVCIPGKVRYDEHPSEAHLDRFASASIPVPRLPVHVKRLVAAGHKVGVVRQMETAALKKVGDNRNAPFVRQLTSVYTKGTYIDDLGELEPTTQSSSGSGQSTSSSSGSGYLLCITEASAQGSGTDEKVQVGVLAVQPATGDILYDSFEDGFMRNEIETRLLHIAPCELLLVGDLSRATEKLVQHLSGSATNVFGDRTRVERVASTGKTDAYSHVTQFYADSLARTSSSSSADGEGENTRAALLEKVLALPAPVTVCLSAMITHLTEYGLQHIFDLTKYFAAFSTRQHMLLNGTTLESLEVYRNATDHGLRGSLLWALDKTSTRPGHRLLRKWIGRPLLDRAQLEARVAAVGELLAAAGSARRDKLERLLASTRSTDLERSLIRIYYGKCTRPELVAVLQTLQRISSTTTNTSPSVPEFSTPLVRDALAALPAIHDTVVAFLDKINGDAARRDDKYAFFREAEETDDITSYKVGIAAVEMDLEEHRAEIAETLGKKLKAAAAKPPPYVTVAGIEYLVEVPNTDLRRVPASWIKISGTKRASRFHTPTVVRLLSERDQHKEALAAACDAAFAALLAELAACYQPLRDAVAALATLDCLLSLARVAALPGYCKPTLLPGELLADGNGSGSGSRLAPATLDIRGGRHPVAEHTLPSGYIPFTTRLGGGSLSNVRDKDGVEDEQEPPGGSGGGNIGPRALLITGPNMGGKSSFVRAVALLTLLAQIGSYVPADAMSLTLADAIFTRMGARDNLFAGESTFMVEVSETAAILRAATPRSLVVLDELGRGTSTHDGAAIAQAVLAHVAQETRCLTLFITHYQNLGRVAEGLGPPAGIVQNVHMRFTATKAAAAETMSATAGSESDTSDKDKQGTERAAQGSEEITFLYEVGQGMAHRSYGLNVARLARIPQRVLDVAARKSREMEEDVRVRRLQAAVRLAVEVLGPASSASSAAASSSSSSSSSVATDQLDHLISSIEQL